jgi:hypothetical protein
MQMNPSWTVGVEGRAGAGTGKPGGDGSMTSPNTAKSLRRQNQMRKILLPFAMIGLISLPLVGCDVEGEGETDTDTITPLDGDTGVNPDTTPTTEYRAIIVDDDGIFQNHRVVGTDPCATSSVGAHGADIDAVGLFEDNGTTLVGYFDTVQAKLGTTCTMGTQYTNPTQARGTPNGTLTANFVSLGGGAIIGEFGSTIQIFEGDVVVVYEVGTKCGNDTTCGGVDEGYNVFVADRLDCLDRTRSACQVKVTGSEGAKGEATITLTGF